MIKEYSFPFSDLILDHSQIIKSLGYEDEEIPDPFPAYLDEAYEFASGLKDIKGVYRKVEATINRENKTYIQTENIDFKVGKTICTELNGSSAYAFFICTAGATISSVSQKLLHGDDPVLGYVYDVMGSAIAEAVGDKIQEIIKTEAEKKGEKITNRYSPGYCHWNVEDQHNLFSLFDGKTCGVSLTPSALMHPVKSISGVIGIGKEVKFRDYQCDLCTLENCVYRNNHSIF